MTYEENSPLHSEFSLSECAKRRAYRLSSSLRDDDVKSGSTPKQEYSRRILTTYFVSTPQKSL